MYPRRLFFANNSKIPLSVYAPTAANREKAANILFGVSDGGGNTLDPWEQVAFDEAYAAYLETQKDRD